MVFARNTVNYRCFDDFTIFLLSTNVFYNWHQKLNICVSKWTLWVVLGRYWASDEPSKLVILLSTSFKNHFFEHSASAPQSKPLLEPFWTVFSPQIRSQGASQGGSPNHDFRLPEAFRPAQGPFGLWDPFPTPFQVSFLRFVCRIWTNSWLISTFCTLNYIVKTKNSPLVFCRPLVCNAYDHWLFVPSLNAQYN